MTISEIQTDFVSTRRTSPVDARRGNREASVGFQNLNLSVTESASNFRPQVFIREPQRLVTMRAGGIRIGFDHGRALRVEMEIGRTKVALQTLAKILPIDRQLFLTLGTFHKQPNGS